VETDMGAIARRSTASIKHSKLQLEQKKQQSMEESKTPVSP